MFVHIIKNNFHSSLDIIQFLLICSARLFIYSFRSFFSFIRSHHKVLLLLLPTEWVSGDLCWTNDHHSARRQVIGQLSQMRWGRNGVGGASEESFGYRQPLEGQELEEKIISLRFQAPRVVTSFASSTRHTERNPSWNNGMVRIWKAFELFHLILFFSHKSTFILDFQNLPSFLFCMRYFLKNLRIKWRRRGKRRWETSWKYIFLSANAFVVVDALSLTWMTAGKAEGCVHCSFLWCKNAKPNTGYQFFMWIRIRPRLVNYWILLLWLW